MAFWSTQRIRAEQNWTDSRRLPENNPFTQERRERGPNPLPLISPPSNFKEDNILHGAYELTLDKNVLITPDGSESGVPLPFPSKQAIKIPPGQFALLFTKEQVNIPQNVIAFISLKGNIKFKGLINISGFQVNPGFSGHLKFSVYNASGDDIHLNFNEPCFQIWFADLDAATEVPYNRETGHYQKQSKFTPDDRDRMAKERHSPEQLHRRLEEAEKKIGMLIAVGTVVAIPVIIGFVIAIFDHWFKDHTDNVTNGELIIHITLIVGAGILLLNLLFSGMLKYFSRWLKEKCVDDNQNERSS